MQQPRLHKKGAVGDLDVEYYRNGRFLRRTPASRTSLSGDRRVDRHVTVGAYSGYRHPRYSSRYLGSYLDQLYPGDRAVRGVLTEGSGECGGLAIWVGVEGGVLVGVARVRAVMCKQDAIDTPPVACSGARIR